MSNLKAGPGEQFGPPAHSGVTVTPSTAVTGLSSRQVVFGSPTGGIAQSAAFQVDSTQGFVGIGTSSPAVALHIVHANGTTGPLTGAGLIVQNTSGVVDARTGVTFWNAAGQTMSGVEGVPASTSAQTGGLAFSVVNAGAVNQAVLINSSGNVGIGTTAPQMQLHLAASSPQVMLETTHSSVRVRHWVTSAAVPIYSWSVGSDTGGVLDTTFAAWQMNAVAGGALKFFVRTTATLSTVLTLTSAGGIGFMGAAGQVRPTSYTVTAVATNRTLPSTQSTVAAAVVSTAQYVALVNAFNDLLGYVKTQTQDWAGYGLLST